MACPVLHYCNQIITNKKNKKSERKLDVKDMCVSHLLADAEARSLVSDSFPKMHINNKINVSVKAMCRVAAKMLYRVCQVVYIYY